MFGAPYTSTLERGHGRSERAQHSVARRHRCADLLWRHHSLPIRGNHRPRYARRYLEPFKNTHRANDLPIRWNRGSHLAPDCRHDLISSRWVLRSPLEARTCSLAFRSRGQYLFLWGCGAFDVYTNATPLPRWYHPDRVRTSVSCRWAGHGRVE